MNAPQVLEALIVDDEPLARERVADLLGNCPDVRVAGFAENGRTAVAAIRKLEPDIVFLDVQMPGMTGFEVMHAIGVDHMPATVLVTAHDQFALKAFDAAVVDYLLKPFSDERFEVAVNRLRHNRELHRRAKMTARLRQMLESLASEATAATEPGAAAGHLERIAVESPGQVRVVAVEDIDYISASGVYVELHIAERTYVVRERMQWLEERLNPRQFFRVHRSAIVQLDRVDVLLRQAGGDYTLKLRGGAQISVSRSRVRQLEAWMGVAEHVDSGPPPPIGLPSGV